MKKLFFLMLLSLFIGKHYSITDLFPIHEHINHKIVEKDKQEVNVTRPTYLSNNSTYYFYTLNQNYAKNYQGTCTYVATSMLLQYYDSMWDDNIIPAQYEVESITTESINLRTSAPGIRTDKIPGLTDLEAQLLTNYEYFDYVMDMADMYFQPLLFKIAHEDFESSYLTLNSQDSFASLTQSGRERMLNHYLQNYVGYDADDYTIEIVGQDVGSLPSSTVRSHIINKVRQGIPVIVTTSINANVHTSIVYDYDASTGKLYANWGNPNTPDTQHALPNTPTIIFKSAMTLEFHGTHTHANNYKLVVNGNVYNNCGCDLATHKHVPHVVEQYDDDYHIEHCFCGYSRQDYHTCTGNYGRYEACTECGTVVDLWTTNTNSFIREEELEVA